jgi:hypothetical protein
VPKSVIRAGTPLGPKVLPNSDVERPEAKWALGACANRHFNELKKPKNVFGIAVSQYLKTEVEF